MLELKKIDKYYNPGTVNEMCLFDGFDLTVADGEFVSVVGSNGSGKTSMLNILCGSIPVDGGKILMNGKDITNKRNLKETVTSDVYIRTHRWNLPVDDHSGEYVSGR